MTTTKNTWCRPCGSWNGRARTDDVFLSTWVFSGCRYSYWFLVHSRLVWSACIISVSLGAIVLFSITYATRTFYFQVVYASSYCMYPNPSVAGRSRNEFAYHMRLGSDHVSGASVAFYGDRRLDLSRSYGCSPDDETQRET